MLGRKTLHFLTLSFALLSMAVYAVETPDFWAERNKDGNRRNAGAKPIDGNLRVRWARNFADMRLAQDAGKLTRFAERADNFSVRDGRIILVVPPSLATPGVKTNDTFAIYGTFSIADGRLLNTVQSPHVLPMPKYIPFDLTDTSPGKIFQCWGSDGTFFTSNGGDNGRTCQFDPYTGEIPAGQPLHWSPHSIDEDGAFAMTDANPRFFINGAKGKAGGYHEYPHFCTRAEVGDRLIKGGRYYAPFLLENKTGYTFDVDASCRTRLTRWDVTENPFTVANIGNSQGSGNGTWTTVDPSIVFTEGSLNGASGYRPICLGEDGRVYYFGFKGIVGSLSDADFSQGMFLVGVRSSDGVADKMIHVDYDILQEAQSLLPGYTGNGLRRLILPQIASRGNTVLVFQPQEEIPPPYFGGASVRSTFTKGHLFCFDTSTDTLRWRYDFPASYFQTNVRPKDNNIKDCQEDVQVVIAGNEAFIVHPLVVSGVLKVQVERFSLTDGTRTTSTLTPQVNGQSVPVTGIDAKIAEVATVDGTIICTIDHGYDLFNASPLRGNPTSQVLIVIEGDASTPKDYPPVAVISAPVVGASYFEGILSDYLMRPTDEFYAGISINFSSLGSVDADGDSIVAYDWSFGDGSTSTQANPTHTFTATGLPMEATDRTVTLRVQDNRGNWSKTATRILSILNAGNIQTTVRTAVADTYVDSATANVSRNFGTLTTMALKTGTRGYIKFDTSGIDLANLASAKLRLYMVRLAQSTSVFQVFPSADNWTETGITWANAPVPGAKIVEQTLSANSSGMIDAYPVDAYAMWMEIPVTDYVRTAGTDGFVSFAFSLPIGTLTLPTKEGGRAPQLVLDTGTFLLAPPVFTQQPPATVNLTDVYTKSLNVLASSALGESNLTYHWQVLSTPATGTATFSANHTNAAKAATITLTQYLPGTYTFKCTVSDGFQIVESNLMTVNVSVGNLQPTVVTAASANPTTTTGNTSTLIVLGTDDGGEANLIYTWSATSGNAGNPKPTFSVNGTNAAKNTVVTFKAADVYTLTVKISDAAGNFVNSSVSVTVVSLAQWVMTPSAATLAPGQTQNFTFGNRDQFGTGFDINCDWTVSSGGGTITTPGTVGTFTAGSTPGTYTVTGAYVGDHSYNGTATVTITSGGNTAPTISSIADQTINEDTLTSAIAFTVGDAQTAVGSLTLLKSSSNTTLVPLNNIVFGGSGANRTVVITPVANQTGTSTITVTVSDGSLTASTTFVLTVNAVNDAPTISAIANQTTNQNTATAAIAFTVGDVETAAGSLTVTGGSSNTTLVPASGIVLGGSGANRTVTVTPATGQTGTATITLTVSDGSLIASTSFVLAVNGVNSAPVANAQSVTTDEDVVKPMTLTGSDPDGNSLTYIIVGNPVHGTLSGSAQNRTYTPAANYNGPDSFTFKVNDGSVDSPTATVSITVTAVNDVPVANAQSVTTNEDAAKPITLTGSDVESFSLIYTVVTQPAHGLLIGTAPALTYTPDANYNGSDSFTFKVNDGTVDSSVATVSITVTALNDLPVANAQSVTTNEDVAKPITLGGSDVEGSSLTYTVVTQPAHGTLSGSGQNLIFTPTANYNGSDSFTFKVNDGTADSAAATVSITITAVNDTPTISNIANQTTNQDTATSAIAFTVGDVETAVGSLTLTKASSNTTLIPTANIVFGGSGANRTVTLTPAAGQTGTSTITLTVSDGSLTASDTFVLTVNGVNHAPVALAQSVTTNEDVAVPVTLIGSDADGDVLSYAVVTQPAHGTLTGSGQSVTYTPAANYNGSDNFTFRVNDGTVNSSAATISITVTAVADTPVANAQSVTTNEDAAKAITLSGTDADGDSLTYVSLTQPVHGTLSGTAPNLTYTPAANYYGSDSFTFKVKDAALTSSAATVSINVVAVNDPPVANNQAVTTSEDTMISLPLTGSDVEGSALTLSFFTPPAHGSIAGTISNTMYVPDANYSGPDSFTFRLNDGTADSNLATISITVTPVNDSPIANAQSVAVTQNVDQSIKLTGSDVDGDTLTYIVSQNPTHGTLFGTAPYLIYTPNTGYTGSDSFTFKVNDGTVDSAASTVSITVSTALAAAPVTLADPSTGTTQPSNTSPKTSSGGINSTVVISPSSSAATTLSAPTSDGTLTSNSGVVRGGGNFGAVPYAQGFTDGVASSYYPSSGGGGVSLPSSNKNTATSPVAPGSYSASIGSSPLSTSSTSNSSSLRSSTPSASFNSISSQSAPVTDLSVSVSSENIPVIKSKAATPAATYGALGGALAVTAGLSVLLSETVRNTFGISDTYSMGTIVQESTDFARRLFRA